MKYKINLCLCGCGEYTKPGNKYILGHNQRKKINKGLKGKPSWNKGIHMWSEEERKKISDRNKGNPGFWINKTRYDLLRENHPKWKGDNATYVAKHTWIRNHKPKPKFCEICKKNTPQEVSNISGKHKRDINDYQWLCIKCHRKKDAGERKNESRTKESTK